MSERKRTLSQLQAINLEGGNILVSAGAGSGKTSVLTERVIRKLRSGISLDNLVIITFTTLAAEEMRQRIKDELRAIPELVSELAKIDQARISTFDALCLRIVREHHFLLGVDSEVGIADSIILDILKNEALTETFKEAYQSNDPAFQDLIMRLFDRSDVLAREAVMTLARGIDTYPDKVGYLNRYEEYYLGDRATDHLTGLFDEYLKRIPRNLKIELDRFISVYQDDSHPSIANFMNSVKSCYLPLLEARDTTAIILRSNQLEHPRLPRASKLIDQETIAELKAAFSPLKEKIKRLSERIGSLIVTSEAEMKEAFIETRATIKTIVGLTKRYLALLTMKQKERNLYHFSDIMAMAIRLFEENPAQREEYTSKIQEVLVDEYQDTNDLQDRLLELLARDNLFLVGDVKQAIYGFRDANPRHFQRRYRLIKDEGEGTLIELVDNFRSRGEVLSVINEIFLKLMDQAIGGIDYHDNQSLATGQKGYQGNTLPDAAYGPAILTYSEADYQDQGISKMELEAKIVASDIARKLDSGFQVYDLKAGKMRPIRLNDIAVIIDRKTDFHLFQRELVNAGIPVNIYADEPFSEGEEIRFISLFVTTLASLRDESLFQKHFKAAFVGLCRSFVYRIDDDAIVNLVLEHPLEQTSEIDIIALIEPFSEIIGQLSKLVELVDRVAVHELLLAIYDTTEIFSNLFRLPNPELRESRLDHLFEKLQGLSGICFADLVGYLEHVYLNREQDIEFQKPSSLGENAVNILTMHKAKGLEYSVCYYPGLGKKFNYQENKNHFVFDRDYGLFTKCFAQGFKNTFIHILGYDKNYQEYVSERIRLFYVALTRAKEQQILILEDKYLEERPARYDKHGVIDLDQRKELGSYAGLFALLGFLRTYVRKTSWTYQKHTGKPTQSTAAGNTLAFIEYQNQAQPIKNSSYSKEEVRILRSNEVGAIIFGRKIHRLLENFDFRDPGASLKNIPGEYRSYLEGLLGSEPFKDIHRARIYREMPFMATTDLSIRRGVIDLVIEKEELCYIIDYKLKHVDDPAYRSQLAGYKEYVETITGKPVRTYLYSLIQRELIEIGGQ